MKVCFETFGCRLNRAEALEDEAACLANGWTLTTSHAEADLFVIRGCSVTAKAQHECEKLIDRLRRHHPNTRIIVRGCLPNRMPDTAFALHATAEPPVPTRTARAYLKVQDGCSGLCTFCIVPTFRGKSVSESFTSTIDKARRFIESGYHEIVVTGCNLSLYGSEGKRLPDLLIALAGLSADCRIRLGSLEPGLCGLEVVHALAETDNICRFLHLPIQSGSNRILTSMRRPYLERQVNELIETACKLMPDIGLGCDLMTGYPDETEIDFRATESMLRRYPFSNAHIFPYSERPGTIAAQLPGKILTSVRSQRAHKLASLATEKRLAFAKRFKGKLVEVLVEDEQSHSGWTSQHLWFDGSKASTSAKRKELARFVVSSIRKDVLTTA